MRRWAFYKRVVIPAVYVAVIVVQLILWPACEDGSSSSLLDDLEDTAVYEPPPLPVNLLNPPMWGSQLTLTATGHCGTWHKQYTKLHRAMLSGELPASYLVYTTGQGFPPVIEGVPQALKGIATVFMIALLTERAFILDWQSPSGFDRVIVPRYINWMPEDLFNSDTANARPAHTHDLGSASWFQNNNGSIDFYTNTNFDEYFASNVEVIQSLSYDFTYAILRNPHYKHKLQNLGLHTAKCRLCCIWHYLFKYASEFQQKMNMYAKSKLGLSTSRDLLFMDISFQHERLPKRTLMQYTSSVMKCAERVSKSLRSPIWVVASNSYIILDELPRMYSNKIGKNALFFSKERYNIDLQREINSTDTHFVTVPRYEHNALMYYFMGYYLQLNSTILFTSHHSQYSASMAGLRHFYHTSGRYIVNLEDGCQLRRYGTQ